jgi:mxaK protein
MSRNKLELILLMGTGFIGIVCCAIAVWFAWHWQGAKRFNSHLASISSAVAGADGVSVSASQQAMLKVAQAEKLRREGKETEALALLRDVEAESQAGSNSALNVVNAQAKFNSANIYLRQAIELLSRGERAKALPPTELAKTLYRDVIRMDSRAWDARYNLERALVIFPEVVNDDDEAIALPPPGERAVTTMRGVSPGLP